MFYPEDMKFEIGRGITVREGGDVTIITTGTVLHKALAAAELLEAKGIQEGDTVRMYGLQFDYYK